MEALEAAYQQARTAIAHYRLPDARRHLDEARRLLAGVVGENRFELELRIRLTESWLTCDDLGLPAALEQVSSGLRDAQEAGRDDLRGLAHIQAGVLNARAGHVEEALVQLRDAVELSAALPVEDRVRLLINKGAIGSQAGELDEAARDLRTATLMARELPAYAFMATHNLGFVEYLRGDLPAALRWMAEADALPADVDRSVSRLDRARVLMEVGLVDEAGALLAEASQAMEEVHLTQELIDAQLEMARCALLRGDPERAVEVVDGMAEVSGGRGEERRDLEARSLRLESLGARAGIPTPELVAEAAALVVAARDAGWVWLADRSIARWVILARRAGMDIDGADVAVALGRMRHSPYLATRSLAILAQLRLSTDAARRRKLVRVAAHDVAVARAGMSNLDLRSALAIHITPVIDVDLADAVGGRDAWAALAATERWRTALNSVPSVLPPADPTIAALWSRLRQRSEELRDAEAAQAVSLRADVTRIERRLREQSWTGSADSSIRNARRPRRTELGKATVLNYLLASGAVWMVRIMPGRKAELLFVGPTPEVVRLAARATADASAAARVGQGLLAAGVLGSLHESLARLDEQLLPEDIGDAEVVIVPGGSLVHLPWGMLPRLRRRSVTVSRSLTAWHAGRTRVHGTPRVAVATGPGLELAKREADAVRAQWSGAAQVRGEPAAVADALTRHDVVHVAAHGSHRADNPLFSSLRLHGGSLFAHELERVNLASSLVMLSACSAGRAQLRPGDEALGLTSSLLAMGVKAVVAPMTDVPDQVAFDTMVSLHARLSEGEDGPTALAAASGTLLARSFTWFGSNWQAEGTC